MRRALRVDECEQLERCNWFRSCLWLEEMAEQGFVRLAFAV